MYVIYYMSNYRQILTLDSRPFKICQVAKVVCDVNNDYTPPVLNFEIQISALVHVLSIHNYTYIL